MFLRRQTVAKKTTVRGLKDIMRRVMHFPPHAPLVTFDAENPKYFTRLGSFKIIHVFNSLLGGSITEYTLSQY